MSTNCEKLNQIFCKLVSGHCWKHDEETGMQVCMFCGYVQHSEEVQITEIDELMVDN